MMKWLNVAGWLLCTLLVQAEGHGRLLEPPARASMWRQGFDNVKDYNDNELNCGGFYHQMQLGYKCGICGDRYDATIPRKNERGGIYGKAGLVRTYQEGSAIDIGVQITDPSINSAGKSNFILVQEIRRNNVRCFRYLNLGSPSIHRISFKPLGDNTPQQLTL